MWIFPRNKRYIIWAKNPFETELTANRREIAEFARWAKVFDYALLAVYALQVPNGRARKSSQWIPNQIKEAEEELSSYVKDFGLEKIGGKSVRS